MPIEEDPDLMVDVKPDSWNNIPFPLVDTFKILMQEIRNLKSWNREIQTQMRMIDKKVQTNAQTVDRENEKIQNEFLRVETSLRTAIDMKIQSNNTVI